MPIYAEVYVGPWLGTVYEGTLSLDMDAVGAIDSGSFDLLDGTSYPLVGQATGRGLDLRVDLGSEQLLTLTGTAQADFALCQGEAAGSFGGPEMGNMGTWITTGPGQLTPVGFWRSGHHADGDSGFVRGRLVHGSDGAEPGNVRVRMSGAVPGVWRRVLRSWGGMRRPGDRNLRVSGRDGAVR